MEDGAEVEVEEEAVGLMVAVTVTVAVDGGGELALDGGQLEDSGVTVIRWTCAMDLLLLLWHTELPTPPPMAAASTITVARARARKKVARRRPHMVRS